MLINHVYKDKQQMLWNMNRKKEPWIIVDNNLSVNEIMENESLFHDTTRQQSKIFNF